MVFDSDRWIRLGPRDSLDGFYSSGSEASPCCRSRHNVRMRMYCPSGFGTVFDRWIRFASRSRWIRFDRWTRFDRWISFGHVTMIYMIMRVARVGLDHVIVLECSDL